MQSRKGAQMKKTNNGKVKQQISININIETIDYFKKMAKETDVPYQTLINFYLEDCVKNKKELQMKWD